MGASSSRMGSRPNRRPNPKPKRKFSALFSCGGASDSSFFICGVPSSSGSPSDIEDDPAEFLVNSAECSSVGKFPAPRKDSAHSRGTGSGIIAPKLETGVTSERSVVPSENHRVGEGPCDVEASNRGKYLSESKGFPSHHLISNWHSGQAASSSYTDQPSADPVPVTNGRANMDVNGSNTSLNRNACSGVTQHGTPSSNELGESSSDESSIENNVTEVMTFQNYDSSTASALSDSPLNNHLPRDCNLQEAGPAGVGLLVPDRGQDRRDASALHVDTSSVPSSVVSSSSSETNNEARRNSRRLFWDTFSRRRRRYTDSHHYLFANDDSDQLRHRNRWLLDFGGDLLDEGVGGDFRSYGYIAQGNSERRRHSRSQILERIRGGLDGNGSGTALCPSGIHPEGSCSCEPILRAEESGPRASISRIVMLAEALFEVLDEIHRQPLSVSLPVVSLPAPESVVNSFPMKSYRKPERSESVDDVGKCYICLAEYEEGDEIRALPCHHEYHMLCVDKWLKEIHGICPLCRADVCEGVTKDSASTFEGPSLQ